MCKQRTLLISHSSVRHPTLVCRFLVEGVEKRRFRSRGSSSRRSNMRPHSSTITTRDSSIPCNQSLRSYFAGVLDVSA